MHGRLPGRALPLALRRLDRAARGREHHRRLRRRQLLPLEGNNTRGQMAVFIVKTFIRSIGCDRGGPGPHSPVPLTRSILVELPVGHGDVHRDAIQRRGRRVAAAGDPRRKRRTPATTTIAFGIPEAGVHTIVAGDGVADDHEPGDDRRLHTAGRLARTPIRSGRATTRFC